MPQEDSHLIGASVYKKNLPSETLGKKSNSPGRTF